MVFHILFYTFENVILFYNNLNLLENDMIFWCRGLRGKPLLVIGPLKKLFLCVFPFPGRERVNEREIGLGWLRERGGGRIGRLGQSMFKS